MKPGRNSIVKGRLGHRISQTVKGLTAQIDEGERRLVTEILGEELCEIFFSLPLPDQRHCLDLLSRVAGLRELSLGECKAILLHDVGKSRGNITIPDRILFVLLRSFLTRRVTLLELGKSRLARSLFVLYNHPKLGKEIVSQYIDDERLLFLIENHHSKNTDNDEFMTLLQEYDDR